MAAPSTFRPQRKLAWLFWLGLAGFLAWDWWRSPPIDFRQEPPLIAAGSGRGGGGAHCSMPSQ